VGKRYNSIIWCLGVIAASIAVSIGVISFLSSIPVMAQPDNWSIRDQMVFTNYNATASYTYCDSGSPPPGIVCTTGSAAGDGWITANGNPRKSFQVEIDTISGTSLDFKIEARLQGNEGQAAQIWPGSGDHSETTTGSFIVQVPDIVYQVRIGVKITGDSGTQNVDVVYNSVQGR
jgi:hypothetical protein